jgi:hypothetical protein
MEVDSMREMYKQYLFQRKQVMYLEQIKGELITTISQLRNEAPIPHTHRVIALLMYYDDDDVAIDVSFIEEHKQPLGALEGG